MAKPIELKIPPRNNHQNQETESIISDIAIYTWDLINNKIIFNAKCLECLGYTMHEIPDNDSVWKFLIHPDDLAPTEKQFAEFFVGFIPIFQVDYRIRHKNGEYLNVINKGKITKRNEDNQPTAFASTMIDISYQKLIEEDLVKQRQLTLHYSKLAEVGQLAASIIHEIINPMTIIKGNLEILNQELTKKQTQKQKMKIILKKIQSAGERIVKITQGLKSLARAKNETKELIELNKLVADTFELITEMYQKNGITLTHTKEKKEIKFWGYHGHLQQMLLNLIMNAKDAITDRALKVIEVVTSESSDSIEIRIKDSGPGIDPKIMDKIFQPFFTTKGRQQGSGLGLAIVQDIVEMHGGEISCVSRPDLGTEFSISFKNM